MSLSKREFLVKLAYRLTFQDREKLKKLFRLYKVPDEIFNLIRSPTLLFHYLDSADSLSLVTLANYLKLSNFINLSEFVEDNLDEIIFTKPTPLSLTIMIINTLRECLTCNNIYDLSFLIKCQHPSERFENYLLELFLHGKVLTINSEFIQQSLITIGNYICANKFESFFKELYKTQFSSLDEKRMFLLMEVAKQLSIEDVSCISFLLRLPYGISEDIANPTKLFHYLETENMLDFSSLENCLRIIGKSRILNDSLNKEIPILTNFDKLCIAAKYNPFQEIQNSLSTEDIMSLSYLLGSPMLAQTLLDYFVQLYQYGIFQDFDLGFIKESLRAIKRTDIALLIESITENKPNIDNNFDQIQFKRRIILFNIFKDFSLDDIEKISVLFSIAPNIIELFPNKIQALHYIDQNFHPSVYTVKEMLLSIGRDVSIEYYPNSDVYCK